MTPSRTTNHTKLWVFGAGSDDGPSFLEMKQQIAKHLLEEPMIHRGQWQTLDVSASDAHTTYELRNVSLFYQIPQRIAQMVREVEPDLPWANEHFLERVGGEPLNPPPSYVNWPHHGSDSDRHVDSGVFSHTYPERFWPKRANPGEIMQFPNGRVTEVNCGIRYAYGDLDGVVDQLVTNPLTRQAVLPVFFPEDTGQTTVRIPCSLFYHFMADEDLTLHVWYSLRSCDFVRHFHNDVYFAVRLARWVAEQVFTAGGAHFKLGELNMTISSLHAFAGDLVKIQR